MGDGREESGTVARVWGGEREVLGGGRGGRGWKWERGQ